MDFNPEGILGVRASSTGEWMHSGVDPLPQAEALYINQLRIHEGLNTHSPLCVWDVGLGAGVNATALIQAARAMRRKIIIESFEVDISALRLVLENSHSLIHPGVEALTSLLAHGIWQEEFVEWKLFLGDFKETVSAAGIPHRICWDPFSLKTDVEMWQQEELFALHQYGFNDEVVLSTYSSATRFRAALLSCGWWVGAGVSVSSRKETTIAGSRAVFERYGISPLDKNWLKKFLQSSAQFPDDWENSNSARRAVSAHPQF